MWRLPIFNLSYYRQNRVFNSKIKVLVNSQLRTMPTKTIYEVSDPCYSEFKGINFCKYKNKFKLVVKHAGAKQQVAFFPSKQEARDAQILCLEKLISPEAARELIRNKNKNSKYAVFSLKTGGRPPLETSIKNGVLEAFQLGYNPTQIARLYSISRFSVYKVLKKC